MLPAHLRLSLNWQLDLLARSSGFDQGHLESSRSNLKVQGQALNGQPRQVIGGQFMEYMNLRLDKCGVGQTVPVEACCARSAGRLREEQSRTVGHLLVTVKIRSGRSGWVCRNPTSIDQVGSYSSNSGQCSGIWKIAWDTYGETCRCLDCVGWPGDDLDYKLGAPFGPVLETMRGTGSKVTTFVTEIINGSLSAPFSTYMGSLCYAYCV